MGKLFKRTNFGSRPLESAIILTVETALKDEISMANETTQKTKAVSCEIFLSLGPFPEELDVLFKMLIENRFGSKPSEKKINGDPAVRGVLNYIVDDLELIIGKPDGSQNDVSKWLTSLKNPLGQYEFITQAEGGVKVWTNSRIPRLMELLRVPYKMEERGLFNRSFAWAPPNFAGVSF